MIGEEEAAYSCVNVNRLKWIILSVNVVIVAVATAFTGVISFVRLIVPHILRMMRGADNRFLIAGSAVNRSDLAERSRPRRAARAATGRAADRHCHVGVGVPVFSICCGGGSTFFDQMLEAIDVTFKAGGGN